MIGWGAQTNNLRVPPLKFIVFAPMQPTTVQRLPQNIANEGQLEEVLTRPRVKLVEFIKTIRSPLIILGAGGKMGPTLAVLARRAAEQAGHKLDVIAVSRFTDPRAQDWLEGRGVATSTCDLLDRRAVCRLPAAANLLYLVGLKFGTAQNPALTWAANTLVPAHIAEHYAEAQIVALSTGNVYPFKPARGGAVEADPLTPSGEYANAAVGRERIFEFSPNAMARRLRCSGYFTPWNCGTVCCVTSPIRSGPASRSIWQMAGSTVSGKAMPTTW